MAIDTRHVAYEKMAPDWRRMRDVLAGQRAMRENAAEYLRMPSGMDPDDKRRYVESTEFFEATLRTQEGLTGLAFYREPTINLPGTMDAFRADVTQDGVPLRQFAERLFEEVLAVARVGVLVDYPQRDASVKTQRDADLAGRRPFLRHYTAENILNWETGMVRGAIALTEVRLAEIETEKVGEWGTRWRHRIRVLQLVGSDEAGWRYIQRVFTHRAWEGDALDAESSTPTAPGGVPGTTLTPETEWTEGAARTPQMDVGKPFNYIPFWIINPTDQSPEVRRPPLLGLANSNIGHFKTTGMLENALFWCGNPQLYITGVPADATKVYEVGSSTAWTFSDKDAKVEFASFGADHLSPLEKRLDRLEQHMAVQGARMLSADKKGVEAADTARINRQGEISVLAGICASVSNALQDIIRVATEWQTGGVAGEFLIFTAFFDQLLTPADAVNLLKLWQAGVMDIEDLVAQLKKAQFVGPDKTVEKIASINQTSPVQALMPGLTNGGGTGFGSSGTTGSGE